MSIKRVWLPNPNCNPTPEQEQGKVSIKFYCREFLERTWPTQPTIHPDRYMISSRCNYMDYEGGDH